MLACIDVAYTDTAACAAGLLFRSWTDSSEVEQVLATAPIADAMHGQYRLPTLLKAVDGLARAQAGRA